MYNNLAQYGDQPMRELIAAATDRCDLPLEAAMAEDRRSLTVDLAAEGMPEFGAEDSLFLDTDGSAGLEVTFRFTDADGNERLKSIRRGERLRRTGRFYMPLSGLWRDGATHLSVEMSAPMRDGTSITACIADNSGEDA